MRRGSFQPAEALAETELGVWPSCARRGRYNRAMFGGGGGRGRSGKYTLLRAARMTRLVEI